LRKIGPWGAMRVFADDRSGNPAPLEYTVRMAIKVLAFSGSMRQASFNTAIVRIAAEGARAAGAEVTVVELRDFPMPLYDGDQEAATGMPEHAKRFKQLLLSHQALLIASPEHNSCFSAALKNALDWASRSAPGEPGLAAFAGKTAAICAASPGGFGGLRGLVPLRALLSGLGVIVLPQQVAISKAGEAIERGACKDPKQQQSLLDLGARLAEVARKLNG
jgi:NAD(P)H-dependent FMN reductase